MDIILEKATELGVKTIQPLLMDHCVKTKLNRDRAEKIIIAAAKQTGRSLFPKVYEPISLSDWLSDHNIELSIACYMNGNNSISDVIAGDQKTINIIIGPEGDFSNTELNQFQDAKIELVNLSSRRLRSESAAIVSIANVNQIMEGRYE
jgi:16S rRNA (uracil1498-N3)-methyltransferase